MAKPPRLSFAKEPRFTGLAGVASPYPNTRIKLGGRVVGQINAPNWRSEDSYWSVSVTVECDEHPGWKWVRFKYRAPTEPEAREWVRARWDTIASKYKVRLQDD